MPRSLPRRRAAGCALAALVLAVTGCAGEQPRPAPAPARGALTWEMRPRLLAPEDDSGARVLIGMVRNTSGRTLHLDARDIQLEAADGTRLPGDALFTGALGELRLRPADGFLINPDGVDARTIAIRPGGAAPITVSWRESSGGAVPAGIAYGDGTLHLPTATAEPVPPGERPPWRGGAGRFQYEP